MASACSEDKDPSLTITPTVGDDDGGPPGDDGNDSPPGDDSAEETGDYPTTGDPTEEEPSEPTGGPTPERTCELYLDCLAQVNPDQLPEAQQGFGANGTCWQGTPAEAEQCRIACENALETKHEVYPDEPACGRCQVDSDCTNGTQCITGECKFVGCGDELVSDNEVCDGFGCDSDCLGPTQCNPLTSAGCMSGAQCVWTSLAGTCIDDPPPAPAAGEPCVNGEDVCAPGSICAPPFALPDCEEPGCCTQLCNYQVEESCSGGRSCIAAADIGLNVPQEQANFLGLCVFF